MPRLDLDPAGAAAARGVGRVQALDDDALVAGGDLVGEERLGGPRVVGDEPWHEGVLGQQSRERGEPFGGGPVE